MKLFRKILFWTHLTAGVLGGVVILVMSFTGVVLALRPQIQNWVDRDIRYVEPAGPRLTPHALLTSVARVRPGASMQSLAYDRDPAVAATVNLGPDGNVYVNPYTGAVLGSPSATTARLFQSLVAWHRYMGATGESRATGRAATGASNLAFLLLGVTGLYLWWPKALNAKYLRPVVWFKSASTGKARDFNWHNTIGFWCAIPIVIMTASGSVISYTWATNLVYRAMGSPVPAARAAAGGAARGAQQARAETPRQGGDSRRPEGARNAGGPGAPDAATVIPPAIDRAFARAEQQVPTWEQLSFRLPNRGDGPVQFTLMDGAQWNNFARSQLTLNGATAEVVQWQPYEGQSLGQKARGWLRFAHTGELGGLTGQIIAGIGCLGGMFLVYTGFALAFRRLVNWSVWNRAPRRAAPLRDTTYVGVSAPARRRTLAEES